MAIVKDDITILKHVPVNSGLSYELIKPFVEDAEETYLVPLIGREFYEQLEENGSTDEKFMRFLERAISNIALWLYLPIGNVQISDSGIQIVSNSERKMAFEWQVNQALNSFSKLGMNNLEQMLLYLEANVNADEFAVYKNSPTRAENNHYFISTALEFNKNYSVDRSLLTFYCLQPISRQVQEEYVDPLLAEVTEDLSETAVRYIKRFIAFQTIVEAIPQLSIEVSNMGLSVNYLTMMNNIKANTPAADNRIERTLQYAKDKAKGYFENIPSLLPGYTAPEESAEQKIPCDSKIFPAF